MTGRLVSNTGPVIALALIDRIDILQKLFQQVSIPDAVHKELLEGGSSGHGLPSYNKAT
jgi:predicted nucleic acid-binding protein